MKRFTKIALPEARIPVQLPLLAEQTPHAARELYAPFPHVYRDLSDLDRVLADVDAHSPGLLGLDMEYDSRTMRPSILGLSGLNRALSVPWTDECAKVIDRLIDDYRLVAYSTYSADKACLNPYIPAMDWQDWLDGMVTHYIAHQDLCKRPSKEEDDDAGALGFMNLWTALSLVADTPCYKNCRGIDCYGPCPSHDVFGYNGCDAWAGLKVHVENSAELDRMGVPAQFREEMLELSALCEEMRVQGVSVDAKIVASLDAEFKARKAALFAENEPFNPKSPKTVVAWLKAAAKETKLPELAIERNDKECVQDAIMALAKRYDLDADKPDAAAVALRDFAGAPDVIHVLCDLQDYKSGGKGVKAWFDPRYFDAAGLLHPRTIVTGTSTGRLSCSSPNLQNVPKVGWGKKVRAAIVPREGCKFIRADFKQLELRMCLYLAGVNPKDIGKDAFTWLVGQSNGAFSRAAAMTGKSERDVAKRVSHACLTGDHEVLTPVGWKRIDELDTENNLVAQWDSDWKIRFVKVSEKWHFDASTVSSLLQISGRGVSTLCTHTHKFPVITRGTWDGNVYEKLHKLTFADAPSHGHVPVAGILSNDCIQISDNAIRQAVAIQADGSLQGKKVRFHLVRERKKERIRLLFPDLVLAPCSDHENGVQGSVAIPNDVRLLLDDTKHFRLANLLRLSLAQRRIFLEESLLWDGSQGKRSSCYSNTNYEDCVAVQTISHLSGYQALLREDYPADGIRKACYRVSFNRRRYFAIGNVETVEVPARDVYCITVPSGYFLVRHRDRISVTGNSDYGEGITVLSSDDLSSMRTKAAIAAGALKVYPDWEYAGGLVAFTGANLAEALFGDKSWASRKKALEIQEDIYFANFPQIRAWQHRVLAEVEARGYVKYPTGRFLRLSGANWDEESRPFAMTEDAKIAFAALGSGVSADHVQAVMLHFRREVAAIPTLQIHDELLFEVPVDWPDVQCAEFIRLMTEETWRLLGFSAPVDAGVGTSWLAAMEAADKHPLEIRS